MNSYNSSKAKLLKNWPAIQRTNNVWSNPCQTKSYPTMYYPIMKGGTYYESWYMDAGK